MDEFGYPTEQELLRIRKWDCVNDLRGLVDFAESLWSYPDRFHRYGRGRKLYLSTGGWSGNESIIGALERNYVFWAFTWRKSKRGGHYWFELPTLKLRRSKPEAAAKLKATIAGLEK